MARPNRIKFNSRAFARILTGGGTMRAVTGAAYRMRAHAGGTVVRSRIGNYGGGRAIAYVVTQPKSPEQAEAQREALEAAAHGA